jgi:hypothetical protein
MSRRHRRGGVGQPSASETGGADLLGDAFDDGADGDAPFEEPTAGEMAGAPDAATEALPPSSPPLIGPTAAEVPHGPPGLAVGDRLRCEHFEGNLSVRAEVREIREEGTQALLWIPALGRNWPIQTQHITGDRWIHDPGDYPPQGENEEFDREFRPPVPEPKVDAPVAEGFEPPRRARLGYVWAVTRHNVEAAGFDVEGAAARSWKPNRAGEFRSRDVDAHPRAFRRL